jgi:hypothetical protein
MSSFRLATFAFVLLANSGLAACMAPVGAPASQSSSSSSGGAEEPTNEQDGNANKTTSSSSSSSSSSSGGASATCDAAPAIPAAISGGCAPRLVTPSVCEEIDLSNGQSYEFAWTTDGTGCETPWTVCVGGNPLTDANSGCVKLSTNLSNGISRTGGVVRVTANDLAGLQSDNGTYHWIVKSYYGSHPASVAFKIKK